MFIFRRHRVRVRDKKKTINVAEKDWNVMKMLSKHLKVPMVQVFHNAILVYTGFVYGVDDQLKKKLLYERNVVIEEWRKDRELLQKYIQQFGEFEWPETS